MQLCNLPYNFLYFILSLSRVPWRCSLIFIFQNTLHFVNYILEITSKVSVILYLLCPLPFQIFSFFNSRYAYTHFSITYLIYVQNSNCSTYPFHWYFIPRPIFHPRIFIFQYTTRCSRSYLLLFFSRLLLFSTISTQSPTFKRPFATYLLTRSTRH